MVCSSDVVGEEVGGLDQGDTTFDDFVEIPHPRPVSSAIIVPEYMPLGTSRDEIRILKLHRSAGDDLAPITCSLEHVEFRHDPHYEALSYTWGTRKSLEPVIVVDSKHVTVRENLWMALKALRLPFHDRKLWVDSICINQSDIKERNGQVRLMPFIYERAQCVAVWLGPDINGSASVLSKLNPYYITKSLAKDRLAKAQLLTLCESGYWKRLWIIQEVQMAARLNVYCESYWTPWPLFIQAIRICTALEQSVPLRLERHRNDQTDAQHQLSRLLEDYQYALCEDPRDKIFGLAGLATNIDDKTFVDYSKSVDDVWRDTVLFQHEVQIKEIYGDLDDEDPKLPSSGILPFSQFLRSLLKLPCQRPEVHQFSANMSNLPVTWSRGIIRLEANIIGNIQLIGPSFADILGSFDATRQWDLDLIKRLKFGDYDIGTVKRINSKFIRCLLEMANSDLSKFEPLIMGISWKAEADQKAAARPDISSFEAHKMLYPDRVLHPQANRDAPSCREPRMFAMRTCVPGLAPHNAVVGDIICRVGENLITLVLRQTEDRFIIVGRALVDGYGVGYTEDAVVDSALDDFETNFPSGILMDIDTLGFLTSP